MVNLDYVETINKELETHFQKYFKNETMKLICSYCLKNGKRFRPSIALDISNSLSKSTEQVLQASLIAEYLHTSSLLIDDLPCMDNAKIRRGQESCHVKFGEAVTQVASVVFVSLGFDAIQEGYKKFPNQSNLTEIQNFLLKDITTIIGNEGIAGGQLLDLSFEKKEIGELFKETKESIDLDDMIIKKTGALFELSFVIGWLFGGGSLEKVKDVKHLAKQFSLFYQIADDFNDFEEDKNDKNYVRKYGKEFAINKALALFWDVKTMLGELNLYSDFFRNLLKYLGDQIDSSFLNLTL